MPPCERVGSGDETNSNYCITIVTGDPSSLIINFVHGNTLFSALCSASSFRNGRLSRGQEGLEVVRL